jgi:cysteine desulfurase
MSRIYLDYNSTTPLLPEVMAAMEPYFTEKFGNPASAHRSGAAARHALETARSSVAECLGAQPDEVIFTSSATEANNLALFGLAPSGRGEIVVSSIEHPSVLEPAKRLNERGNQVRVLPVDTKGKVCTFCSGEAIAAPHLVSVQLANHETGTLQDIAGLAKEANGSTFHTDATQAVGKVPVNFHTLGVAALACSAHKFYGPKGIGALLLKRGMGIKPLFWGGHQQQGFRPGTEPVALAVGMAAALRLACEEMHQRRQHCLRLCRRFLETLHTGAEPIIINGHPTDSLAHTLNISFPGCLSDLLLIRLDLAGIDCSTGSACSSGSLLPSPVLQAMRCAEEVLMSAMRFSLSHLLTIEQVEEAARRIVREVQWLRAKTANQK